MKLRHTSGHVTCETSCTLANCYTKWGCPTNHPVFGKPPMGTLITTASNRVLFPCDRFIARNMSSKWYVLPDFDPNSPTLVFDDFQHPIYVTPGQNLRLWYGEDLKNSGEDNNGGETCADVYGWFM